MYKGKFVFVMPTYNTFDKERMDPSRYSNIYSVLDTLISLIEKSLEPYQEIIVINDGSTDETKEILNQLLKKRAEKIKKINLIITIIEHVQHDKVGLNNALITGYKAALEKPADFIVKIDTDGEHDPKKFPKLIKEINRRPDTVFVYGGPRDQIDSLGFGYRIIRRDALDLIIDELEEFALKRWNDFPNKREKQRGIDQETKKLVEKIFPDKLGYTNL